MFSNIKKVSILYINYHEWYEVFEMMKYLLYIFNIALNSKSHKNISCAMILKYYNDKSVKYIHFYVQIKGKSAMKYKYFSPKRQTHRKEKRL